MSSLSIFKVRSDEGYELVQPVDVQYEDLYQALTGKPLSSAWRPFAVRLLTEDLGKSLKQSDAPYLGPGALVLRSRAASALRETLTGFAEALPLRCAEADLVLINVTNVLDALDESASKIARFPGGRILNIERHAFRSDVVAGQRVFKLAGLRVSPVFVDASFVETWSGAGLCGLRFQEVWKDPSETVNNKAI